MRRGDAADYPTMNEDDDDDDGDDNDDGDANDGCDDDNPLGRGGNARFSIYV